MSETNDASVNRAGAPVDTTRGAELQRGEGASRIDEGRSGRTVTAIIHGLQWPEAAARAALGARVREAIGDVDIIEAREDPGGCVGASAVMARGAAQARGQVLIFIEPSILPGIDDLRAMIDHAARGGLAVSVIGTDDDALAGVARADVAASPSPSQSTTPSPSPSPSPDLLSRLATVRPDIAERATHDVRTPIVAMSRATYDALGGFDARLWSIGIADDLIARASIAGLSIARVAVAPSTIVAPPAYPLRPAIARLLATRNTLLTLFKTASEDTLGEASATHAVAALIESWQATGLGTETFRFGGSWGRGGTAPWQSMARRITGHVGLDTPLRDPDGCLLPLLAIDSMLDAITTSIDERQTWRRIAREHSVDREHGTQARPASDVALASVPVHAAAPQSPSTDAITSTSTSTSTTSTSTTTVASAAPAVPTPHPPLVSVIVVNWNGQTHLRDCFGSLQRSDYPADRMQLICVDNGSTDGSLDLLRSEFPRVTVVPLDHNTGFTGGNEAGVAVATGDVLLFLNNDMRVEPDCVRELVGALDAGCECTGARVLSWDGRAIDFVRGSLNFEARGFQDFYGLRNSPELATPTDTFFPNGGAFAVTRDAYIRAGGFDPAFFAYYDDVDLGWRLRLTGTQIRVAARAVVYHRHGATSRTQPSGQKRFLMDRNALWTLMKNYGEPALRRTLGPALLLAIRRLLDESRLDRRAALPQRLAPFVVRCRKRRAARKREAGAASAAAAETNRGWPASIVYEAPADSAAAHAHAAAGADAHAPGRGRPPIAGMPLEALGALCAAVESLPQMALARAAVQGRRTVEDREILPRFGRTLEAVWPLSSYRQIQHTLMDAEALPDVFRARTRLLIIGHEALGRHISGPAVRVLEIGRALSAVARVTIATPGVTAIDDPRCTFATYDPADAAGLKRLAEDADVILVQGFTLVQYPFLKTLHAPIVVDLYCPFTLEHLEQTRARLAASAGGSHLERLSTAQREANGVLGVQNQQLLDGDFFLCASETQRDFWVGTLHAQGRINPLTYGDDPTLRRLIDVVPFGLPESSIEEAAAAAGNARVMRGVFPNIGEHDRILLWAGSLLDWQDPLTLIQAIGELARTRRDVKLVFMGTRHPNPLVSPMQVIEESRALATRLGLVDTHVFFNDWVPYDQRALFLREADLGLSTHRDHLETHFSFRTRMLDYLWAGLPIVCTRGDFFGSLVETRGLGATVPPADVAALTAAIARLLDNEDHRLAVQARIAIVRDEMRWSRVVAPLLRYCAHPYLAADRAPAMREFRQRLEQQYRESKWLKQAALRLGVSEFQLERLKQSSLGRAAMSLQTRRALQRAKRG